MGGGGSGAVARLASGAASGQSAIAALNGIIAEIAGACPIASDTKQPAIIGQFGIASLAGLELFLPATAFGQQSIFPAIAMFVAIWALADSVIADAQFGDIAIAALWPIRPKNTPISNARRKNRFKMFRWLGFWAA